MNKLHLIYIFLCIQSIFCLYEKSQYVTIIDDNNFDELVIKSKQFWYLNFCTENSYECKQFSREYEQAAKDQQGKVNYGYVNMDKQHYVRNYYGINGDNIVIFINQEKGRPELYYDQKASTQLREFARLRINLHTQGQIFSGTENFGILHTKQDLEQQVLKSPLPWFLLFCTRQEFDKCIDCVQQFDMAAKQWKGLVKWGLVDIYHSEIVNVFGINGMGVSIFLNYDKPGPVGSPHLVGSRFLKKRDYEMFLWDKINLKLTSPAQISFNKNIQHYRDQNQWIQEVQRIWGANINLFYTNSELFGNNTMLEQYAVELNKVADYFQDKGVKLGKVSVDSMKWIINEYQIWPLPSLIYLPIRYKGNEHIKQYNGEINSEEIIKWTETLFQRDRDSKLVILHSNTFDNQILNSEEASFVQFYVLDKNWCIRCPDFQEVWDQLSEKVSNKIKIAKYNCMWGMQICNNLNIQHWPELIYFPPGKKTKDSGVRNREGHMLEDITQWILDKVKINELNQIAYLQDQSVFEQYCKTFNGICFITALPRLDDPNAKDRQWYINQIEQTKQDMKVDAASFLWVEGGAQSEMEEFYKNPTQTYKGLCELGYPCVLAIDFRVQKTLGYKILFRNFNTDSFKKFVKELISEKRAFIPIKRAIPDLISIPLPDNVKENKVKQNNEDKDDL